MSEPVLYRMPDRVKTSADAPQLAIGLAVRRTSPVEFWMSVLQMLNPLNVKLSYIVQKGADAPGGKLPAAARNAILQTVVNLKIPYVVFIDDDVLFPDIAVYRFWVTMQRHPEAAVITGIYPTKVEPSEPMIYADDESGACWDWPLGGLVPIHSAGAGCQIVRTAFAAKLDPPWFDDVLVDTQVDEPGKVKRHQWGHDRYFHRRLAEEAGGVIYADTGMLCGHFDTELQKAYVLPPDSPCYQREPVGESFVSFLDQDGVLQWRRIPGPRAGDARFQGWLESISNGFNREIALVGGERGQETVAP